MQKVLFHVMHTQMTSMTHAARSVEITVTRGTSYLCVVASVWCISVDKLYTSMNKLEDIISSLFLGIR